MVKFVDGCKHFLLANICHPSGVGIVTFLNELANMEEFLSTIIGQPIILDDSNPAMIIDVSTCMHRDGSISHKSEQTKCLLGSDHYASRILGRTTGWSRPS